MPIPSVLAIDPGRFKCGLAVLDFAGQVLHRDIVPAGDICAAVRELITRFELHAILMGDGTGAFATQSLLAEFGTPCPIMSVDERHTSEEARKRYLTEHPPRGWRRLVPAGLRTPDAPYDDYVAILLAERWLAAQGHPNLE